MQENSQLIVVLGESSATAAARETPTSAPQAAPDQCLFSGVGCSGGCSQYTKENICDTCKKKHPVLLMRMAMSFVENCEHEKIRQRLDRTTTFLWEEGIRANQKQKYICITGNFQYYFHPLSWKKSDEFPYIPFEIGDSWSACEAVDKKAGFCPRCQQEFDRLKEQCAKEQKPQSNPQPEELCIFGELVCTSGCRGDSSNGRICDNCLWSHPWYWDIAIILAKAKDPKFAVYLEVLVERIVNMSNRLHDRRARPLGARVCVAQIVRYGSEAWKKLFQNEVEPVPNYWPHCWLLKKEDPEHITICDQCIINHKLLGPQINERFKSDPRDPYTTSMKLGLSLEYLHCDL